MQLLVEKKKQFNERFFICHCLEYHTSCEIREEFNRDLYYDLEALVLLDSGIIEVPDTMYEEIFSSISDFRFNQEDNDIY